MGVFTDFLGSWLLKVYVIESVGTFRFHVVFESDCVSRRLRCVLGFTIVLLQVSGVLSRIAFDEMWTRFSCT